MLCLVVLVLLVKCCDGGEVAGALYTVCQVQCASGACVSLSYSILKGGGGNISCMIGNVASRNPATEVDITAAFGRVFQTRIALGNMLYM